MVNLCQQFLTNLLNLFHKSDIMSIQSEVDRTC
nr:MAG TPA: hypothetical protein [Caudoviricetes sp.]